MQGIFITARLGSTRLPDKHMKLVDGKPIMEYSVERIAKAFKSNIEKGDVKIIITTSAEEMNTKLRRFEPHAEVFFGDITNIPLRHLQAALTYDLESIIAVDGDDILCSTKAMVEVSNRLQKEIDYVTTKGLPFGLNAFGYSVDFLAKSLKGRREDILETGWGRIFNHKDPDIILFPDIKEHKEKLRFTLDYEEDLQFFREIIHKTGKKLIDTEDQALIDLVLQEKIFERNQCRIEEYWQNFHSKKKNYG